MASERQHPFVAKFCAWSTWDTRENQPDLHNPGIYALAITEDAIAGQPFSFLPQIAYFGMSNAKSGLRGRLKQFDDTIRGRSGHGGADRFRFDYREPTPLIPHLYVATMPFSCSVHTNTAADLRVMGQVPQAEYECIAHHVELYGSLPKYNDKKKRP